MTYLAPLVGETCSMRLEALPWLNGLAVYCVCGWADYTTSVAHVRSKYQAHLPWTMVTDGTVSVTFSPDEEDG